MDCQTQRISKIAEIVRMFKVKRDLYRYLEMRCKLINCLFMIFGFQWITFFIPFKMQFRISSSDPEQSKKGTEKFTSI